MPRTEEYRYQSQSYSGSLDFHAHVNGLMSSWHSHFGGFYAHCHLYESDEHSVKIDRSSYMASATKREILPVPPVEVTLVLSGEEAQTLADLLGLFIQDANLNRINKSLGSIGISGFSNREALTPRAHVKPYINGSEKWWKLVYDTAVSP